MPYKSYVDRYRKENGGDYSKGWNEDYFSSLPSKEITPSKNSYKSADPDREYAANWFKENVPFASDAIDAYSNALDKFDNSPVGKWFGRAGERGVETSTFNPGYTKTTTGNKIGDISADAIGNILGLVAPTPGGASSALSLGRTGVNAATQRLAPRLENQVVKKVLEGAGAGATYGAMEGASQDESLSEIGKKALKEAAMFALLDYGATKGVVKSAGLGSLLFGGQSALSGDNPEDIAINALTGAGMGAFGGLGGKARPTEFAKPKPITPEVLPPLQLGEGQKPFLLPEGTKVDYYGDSTGTAYRNMGEYEGRPQPKDFTSNILQLPPRKVELLPEPRKTDFYAGETGVAKDLNSYNEYVQSLIEPRVKGKYNIKNPALEKALINYNEAIKTIQNHFKTNELRAEEMPRVKSELGIDLDRLVSDIEKAEKPLNPFNVLERNKMEQVVGLRDKPQVKQISSGDFKKKIEEFETAARERINSRKGRLNSNPIEDIADYAIIGAAKIAKGTVDFAKWSSDMIAEAESRMKGYGEIIKPHLKEIYNKAVKLHADYKTAYKNTPIDPELKASNMQRTAKANETAIKNINERINKYKNLLGKVQDVNQKKQIEFKLWQERENLKKAQARSEKYNAPEKQPDTTLDPADDWKDKPKITMKRETLKRIFEDVMGKDAPSMIKKYISPIERSEADRMRWLNNERKGISDLGIKGRTKESELVQKYGEGQYTEVYKDANGKEQFRDHKYTLEDLKKDAPNDWQKIKQAAEALRVKYDNYLDQVNKVLTEAGFDPIPKRNDYFAHFQEVDNLLERYGIPSKDNALPTDINGLTDDFKPNKNFFANALERKGKVTTLDAIQGIDKYLEGVSKLIHHTDNIKQLRGLEKLLREKYAGTDHLANLTAELMEYTNILAGKKARIDRAGEDLVGRKIFGIVDKVRQQIGANMVGANVASALTNYIPLTQSLATTDKGAFVKAMMETIGNTFKNDGFIDKSDFLTRRIGSDRLVMNGWEKAMDKGFWMFKVIDNFVSQVVTRSKYLEGVQKGLSKDKAMEKANDWAGRLMADRSLGSMPTLFEAKTLKPLTQFQLEVNNQLSFITKDIPRNFDKKAAASAIGQVIVYGWLFNNLYEKLTGRRPAFDPVDVVSKALQGYTDPNKKASQVNKQLIENVANQLPFAGIATGGRIPMQGALPNPIAVATGESSIGKELKKVGYGLLPPTGGMQLKKILEGADAVSKGGSYTNGKLNFPVKEKLQPLIFGKNSTPEAQEFYDKNRRALSEEQTANYQRLVGKGNDPQAVYDMFQNLRQINNRMTEIKEIAKSRKPTTTEKAEYHKLQLQAKQLESILNKGQKKKNKTKW